MERELPEYSIEGTRFLVDVQDKKFVEVANPRNTIEFRWMEYRDTNYLLRYDTRNRTAARHQQEEHADVKEVEIPFLTELDPEGMAKKYNREVEEVKGKTDFEVIVDQELFSRRMSGILPSIDIAGQLFDIDIDKRILKMQNAEIVIPIQRKTMEPVPQWEAPILYRFYYDMERRSLADIDLEKVSDTLTAMPNHILILEIPSMRTMDPVGYAQLMKINVKQYLLNSPFEANMKAKVVPWNEAYLQQIISRNKERLKGHDPGKVEKGTTRKGKKKAL